MIHTLLLQAARLKTLEATPPQPPLASATPTRDGYELGGRCCHIGLKEIQISVGLWGVNNYETYKFGAQTFRALVQLIHFSSVGAEDISLSFARGFDDPHHFQDYHIRKTHVSNG